MSMSLQEMLEELLRFYPIKDRSKNDIAQDMVTYRELILEYVYSSNERYDWEKCLKYIQTHRIYKTFPSIPDILEALPYSLQQKKVQKCVDEGSLLVVTLPSGYTYEFTVSGIGRSIEDIKADIKRKFGQCEYKFYPKGTVIIGSKVFEQ